MVSISEPMSRAFNRMADVLFRPFDIGKWFVLGFCAFLAQLGKPSGGGGGNGATFQNVGNRHAGFGDILEWVSAHMQLVIAAGLLIVCAFIAIGVLFIWLSSRGHFMFLDGVARNRAEVVEPWKRFRDRANSLARLRVVLMLISLASVVAGGGAILFGLSALGRHEDFFTGFLTILPAALALFLVLATIATISAVLRDFVVPIMYARQLRVLAAIGVFWRDLLKHEIGAFTLFYLVWFVLALAAGILMVMITCLTCCIAAIPYLGTVFFLPVHVFFRAFPVYFLQEFGPEWRVFPAEAAHVSEATPE